jgi:DNA-binding transcriptional LysR family regulator
VVEGIDLAIWPGPFKDSTLVTRKLKNVGVFFWASRSYVKRYGVPRHPRDLAKHSVVGYVESPTFYNLSNGRKTIKAAFQARLIVDDLETAKTFVMAGEYIGLLPNFLCKTEAKERKIRKVLDGWSYEFRPGPGTLSFIYPPQRYISPKIRAFIDLAIRRESAASAVYVAKPAEASLA